MKSKDIVRRSIVALVCIGMLAAPAPSFAQITDSGKTGAVQRRSNTVDVVLRKGGRFPIGLKSGQRRVATATTDDLGRFSIRGLRTGTHTVALPDGHLAVRLWTGKTAPPAARDRMLFKTGLKTVRGQYEQCEPCEPAVAPTACVDPVTLGVLGLAIASFVVAVNTNNDIDDLQRRIRRISP